MELASARMQTVICGNVGSGTVQKSEWIEYITFLVISNGKLREEKTQDSWKWILVWATKTGAAAAIDLIYADNKRYQTYVRQYGSDKIYKTAGGANVADYH